jgi:hypothetical protein
MLEDIDPILPPGLLAHMPAMAHYQRKVSAPAAAGQAGQVISRPRAA